MPPIPIPTLYAPFASMPSRRLNTQTPKNDSEDADKKETQSPASPETPLPGVLKAVREYEHSRKSFKKKAESKGRQAHKAHCVDPHAVPGLTCAYCRWHPGTNESRSKMLYVKGFYLKDDGDGRDDGSDVPETDWVAAVERRPEVPEVSLAELLRPAKARKTRQKAGDFEVLPNVRSVVILEEAALPEPEVNEPWEYVDWDGDDPGDYRVKQAPSYAEVLAGEL